MKISNSVVAFCFRSSIYLKIYITVMISLIANHNLKRTFDSYERRDMNYDHDFLGEEGIDFGHFTHDLLMIEHSTIS